jgi:hypothetical protein
MHRWVCTQAQVWTQFDQQSSGAEGKAYLFSIAVRRWAQWRQSLNQPLLGHKLG